MIGLTVTSREVSPITVRASSLAYTADHGEEWSLPKRGIAMSNIVNTERNREAIVELNDADLHSVSAASIRSAILNVLCAKGLVGSYTTTDGRVWVHQCPK